MVKSTNAKSTAATSVEAEVKRGPGRPRKYFTEEEVRAAKVASVKKSQAGRRQHNIDTVSSVAATLTSIDTSRMNKATKAALMEAAATLQSGLRL